MNFIYLQNLLANFYQTWHIASLGEGNSNFKSHVNSYKVYDFFLTINVMIHVYS